MTGSGAVDSIHGCHRDDPSRLRLADRVYGRGEMRSRLTRLDEHVIERHIVTLTSTYDHRILHGTDAAEFCATVRRGSPASRS
jgi:hypothetical protein